MFMKLKLKGYLLAFISALTYGMIPLFMIPIKQSGFSLDASLFYRFLIASIFILGYLICVGENLKITWRELLIFIILGLFYALSSEFLFAAYDYLTPGIASTIFFMYPVIVAVVQGVFFKEKITLSTILSLVVVVVGVFALSVKDISSFSIHYFGLFVALMGAFIYGFYMIVVNKSNLSASGMKVAFYSMLFSSFYFLVKSLLLEQNMPIPTGGMFLQLTIFSLITTVLSMTTLIYAIRFIGSTPTAIMGAVEPVIAVGISVGLFGEKLTLNLTFGVILIIAGVLIDIIFRNGMHKNV